jgi:uncharacterized membrane protein YbhN (UPF0104 family)
MIKPSDMGLARAIGNLANGTTHGHKLLSLKLLVRLCVSIGILVFLFVWLSSEALAAAILAVPVRIWILVIFLFVVGHTISALKWRMMLKATGIIVPVSHSVRAHFAGLFANLCLPSIVGGDFVRAAMIVREQTGDMAAITLGSLADRLNDIVALLIIASLACFLMSPLQEQITGDALTILATVLLIGVIASVMLVRFIPRTILPKFLHNAFGKTATAMDSLRSNPFTAMMSLFLSLFIQGGFVGLNIVLAKAMAIEASMVLWMFAWPMAKLVALAPITLGGIGVREVALSGILAPFGIEISLAVAQSLSWEIVLIFTGVLAGIAVAISSSRTKNPE